MGRKDKQIDSAHMEALPLSMRLRSARQQQSVSLTEMATRLGYSKSYLSGIENGNIRITEELIRRYAEILALDQEELAELLQLSHGPESRQRAMPWFVPYQRNAFFTGRDALLTEIHERLQKSGAGSCLLAITGLGGIGKTQIAIEYAFRYRSDYQAVLWLNADLPETLLESCVELASYLNLPEKGAKDRQATVMAVQHWLKEHPHSLLILDNVDNPAAIQNFLLHLGDCRVLITTRRQVIGPLGQSFELLEMSPDESVRLLLGRAQMIPPTTPLQNVPKSMLALAYEISEALDYLPLALTQAASYLEETGCGLASYLKLFREHRADVLQEFNTVASNYQFSVATTWKLSFERLQQTQPASSQILCFCAFLNPDRIYEEFIQYSIAYFNTELRPLQDSPLLLHRAIGELRKYSLIRTQPDSGALSIHRLVQAVIQDSMDEQMRRTYAERTVIAVNHAFPLVTVSRWHETWSQCQRYYSQVEACVKLIDHWQLGSEEVSQLLSKAGHYLRERTQYQLAEEMYQRALKLDRQLYGDEHLSIATDLGNLAIIYEDQQKFERAEELYRQAIFLQEKFTGLEYADLFFVKRYVNLLQKTERTLEALQWHQRMHPHESEHSLTREVVNDNDPRILYNEEGQWSQRQHPGDFNNDAHFTETPNASFQYQFTGVGIEIISDTTMYNGEIEIYIDDTYIQATNTARFSVEKYTQTIVFSHTNLAPGPHTLKVIVVRGSFILDALAVFSFNNKTIDEHSA
ncbi:DUF7779 domain-containing protein [Dictyobacter kobayashii]|uniref:HTH cro/C1-type domain-containing protein n=1 Tax=Dictyobacter kobayashii TaxID=2014872 RepID=A0A402ARS6_9CHLR|nr:helix-turn-helix domain-containing protein [Dictyobacter kobayashii]GCE21763.1 hypothetical protein KDK_55630 [Dictyobacter kobayashii]